MGDQEQGIKLELWQNEVEETIADEVLYNEDWQTALFLACERLYAQKFIGQTYPQSEIETKILNLTKMISIEKNLKITLGSQVSEFFWQEFLDALKMDYTQLVWTRIFRRIEAMNTVYYFSFIPVAFQTTGFPFNFHLEESLKQQFVPGESDEVMNNWKNQMLSTMDDYISTKLLIPAIDFDDEQLQKELEWLELETDLEVESSNRDESVVLPGVIELPDFDPFDLPNLQEEVAEEETEWIPDKQNDEEYSEILAILDRIETQAESQDLLELEVEEQTSEIDTDDGEEFVEKEHSRTSRRAKKENRRKAKPKKKNKKEELPEKLMADEEVDWDTINQLAELAESKTKKKKKHEVALAEETALQTMDQEELVNRVRYLEEELRRANDSKARVLVANERLEHDNQRLERQLLDHRLRWLEDEPTYHKRTSDWYKKIKIEVSEYDELIQKARLLEHIWKINQQLIGTTEKLTIKDQHHTYEFERVQQIKNSAKDLELFVMMDECRNINERVKIRHGFLFIPAKAIIQKRDYDNLLEKAAYFDMMQAENQLLEKMISTHEKNLEEKQLKKVKSVEIEED